MSSRNQRHGRVPRRLRLAAMMVAVQILSLSAAPCTDRPLRPTEATVEITFRGAIERSLPLSAELQECITRAVVARVYPSWRSFEGVAMIAIPPDTWEMTFPDVPINEAVRFRINDKNWCDRNATGAVLGSVSANGVELVQNATTPGTDGEEPGFAFTVDADGGVRQ